MSEIIYNISYENSQTSDYLKILVGTIENISDIDINIDIFINGVKTSPDDISYQDNNIITFKKEMYLNDGDNLIEVIISNITGTNIPYEQSIPITIDILSKEVEFKPLLNNFIGDDDSKIHLHLGNTNVEYETELAGRNKNVLIDTSIESHYFKLHGENAHLYRISKDNIPKIQGDIIKRPLAITFDYVEKIYDGTNDVGDEIKQLIENGKYHFVNTQNEYYDYSNTGFMNEQFEILLKKDEVIQNKHIITNSNIDWCYLVVVFGPATKNK